MTQQLGNYFLNPIGLAALSALIPLIIFYLMRPSPEEKIMPSMTFFQQDKKSGRLQKALKILQRNMMLILHILMIGALATAIASPYIMAEEQPENAVVVIDNSASMKPVFDQVKSEAISELGKTNTVIVANDEAQVELNQVSATEASRFIQSLQVDETPTNIVGALQRAQNYRGEVFIASDFDQSVDTNTDINTVIGTLSASRPLKTFNPSKTNSWGIVDLDISENNATAYVQNYREKEFSLDFSVDGQTKKQDIKSGELKKVSFTLEEGKNTVELEEDGFSTDNKAYIMKPSDKSTEVAVISSGKDRYLMKALEIIEEVEPEHVEPGAEIPNSDVYIVGKTGSTESIDFEKIVSEVENGKGLILYAQKGLEDTGVSDFPVKSVEDSFNTTVSVNRPVDMDLGNISMLESEVEGRALANPDQALVSSDYGGGEIMYLNMDSDSFRQNLQYPVFWKNSLERISGSLSVSELNRKTGSNVLTKERTVEGTEAGFTDIESQAYGFNLLNGEESSFKSSKISYNSADSIQKPRDMSFLAVVLVMVLGLGELVYLVRKGEIP